VSFTSNKNATINSFDGDMLSQGVNVDMLGGDSVNLDNQESKTEKCALLLCAARPRIDSNIFEAVNDSGLVFDGRIVVDGKFSTVDECIYAGGTVAKFSRRYQHEFNLEVYSSRETGARIASSVLQHVDPLSMGSDTDVPLSLPSTPATPGNIRGQSKYHDDSLPRFALPRLQHYVLPGGLHYMDSLIAEQPGPCRTLATAAEDISDNIEEDIQFRYSWATLDGNMRMVRFSYVGTQEIPYRNLSRLVGFNESFLNSLRHSYENGRIDDHIDYLTQDWASALYCQHFEDFYSDLHQLARNSDELKQILTSLEASEHKEETDAMSIKERAEAMTLSLHERVGVGGTKLTSSFRQKLQVRVVNFIRKNRHLLPNYYLPSQETINAALEKTKLESESKTPAAETN
jgi:hypothetical protein